MGYWDSHPMGGDRPLDLQCELLELVRVDYEKEETNEQIAAKLQKNLKKAIRFAEGLESSFVLPYTLVEYGVIITDKETIKVLRDMIGDGGADHRGPDTAKQAKAFKKDFNKLIRGKGKVEEAQAPGLFDKIIEKIVKKESGLVNCR